MIHGISTFLIMCLAQTVRVTFFIYSSTPMYRNGGTISSYRALYEGDLIYLSGRHLLYAIPALLITLFIAVIPTLLLLWFPIGPKVMSKCGLNETKLVKIVDSLYNRLKPVIDSFQGCYRDNFRLFAGLLFLYRITILASVAFSFSYTQSSVLVEAQLIVMLTVHALTQPYKDVTHNMLDSLLLSNLALTNILSIFIHSVEYETQLSTKCICSSYFSSCIHCCTPSMLHDVCL